jgi:hypothetical protein
MPQPLTLSRIAAALVLAIAVAACGDSSDGVTAPPSAQPGATTTAPPATEQPDTQSCAAPERGYRLEFPKRWYTNDAGIAEPCRFFHPEPFTLAPRTEATGIAINVRLNPGGLVEQRGPWAPHHDGRRTRRRAGRDPHHRARVAAIRDARHRLVRGRGGRDTRRHDIRGGRRRSLRRQRERARRHDAVAPPLRPEVGLLDRALGSAAGAPARAPRGRVGHPDGDHRGGEGVRLRQAGRGGASR